MRPDVHATMIRMQQQVVAHCNRLLRRSMPDDERKAITEKIAHEERVLSELLAAGSPALVPDRRAAA